MSQEMKGQETIVQQLNRRRHLIAVAGGTFIVAAAAALLMHGQSIPPSAQELDVPSVLPPTVEGDWVRTDTIGSGRWDNLTSTFTQAVLTPEYVGRGGGGRGGGRGGSGAGGRGGGQAADTGPHQAGLPYVTSAQTCRYGGGVELGLEYDSEGFHMVMGKDEALVVQERGASRRIFLDGRALPDPSVRPPTGSGYSVGKIEPDGTLVVETTDATPGGVTAGGYRLADTHFIQRYIPSADGKHLTLRFEYNDPRIYAKPHSFQYTFDRMGKDSYALEEFCDATDPLNGQSIVPPEQR
jgi:hypothetical protein